MVHQPIRIGSVMIGLLLVLSGQARGGELIRIDGSSTVYPITEAVAEEFQMTHRSARITVGISGTGGGFKKFCRGETDLTNASRPIKAKEIELCRQNAVPFIEIPVAFDGIAVVVNPKNTWAESISVAELKKLWEPAAQRKITRWSQIRADWPGESIRLFGPGVDSGTFDYFTEAVIGKAQASRGDFTASEDDNVLVQGIATDAHALGYFGLAYYQENKERLKLVAVEAGKGPVRPSPETVEDGRYYLSRPLFIYVSVKSLNRTEITSFVAFLLEQGPALALEVGYIPLPEHLQNRVVQRVETRRAGSLYQGRGAVGKSLATLLSSPSH